MLRKTTIAAAVIAIAATCGAAAREDSPAICPDGTYMFAERDTCELFMDVYNPAEGSGTFVGDREKPTVIFVFGGGFISGTRDDPYLLPWYKQLTDNGYKVVAIDYRLGLKGETKVGIAQVNALDRAIHMAVEDLFSATRYIIDNAGALEINPDNIVICGSSAGSVVHAAIADVIVTETAANIPASNFLRFISLLLPIFSGRTSLSAVCTDSALSAPLPVFIIKS